MADYYDKSTVEPTFPVRAVSEFEKLLLAAYGFHSETSNSTEGVTVYFYAPEGLNEDIEGFNIDTVAEFARLEDPIAVDLMRFVHEQDAKQLDGHIRSQYSWEAVLQGILNKPECETIGDICVMGAYTCNKMRPGAFGGWVTRITRDTVQFGGTGSLLMDMRDEDGFLAALEIVYSLAETHCLDQHYVPDNNDGLADYINERARSQRNALNLVHDYLTNHPFVR
jgi:hypothetical protein